MKSIRRATKLALQVALGVGLLAAPNPAAGQQSDGISDWSQVERLKAGTQVTVVVRGTGPVSYRAGFADSRNLLVLWFANPQTAPPRRILRALEAVAHDWPVLRTADLAIGSVRFSRDGVFDGQTRIADLLLLPREDVLEIQMTTTHGSRRGAIAGVAIGGAVGGLTALSIAFRQCGGSCADEKASMALSGFGFPLAGGFLGYYINGRTIETVTIYRAVQSAQFVLDEAAWLRLRQTLPKSLRSGAK